jgi:hypothetical protein
MFIATQSLYMFQFPQRKTAEAVKSAALSIHLNIKASQTETDRQTDNPLSL